MLAQKGLYIGARFIEGFQSESLEINHSPVGAYRSFGYDIHAYYNFEIDNFDLRFGLGFKQLFFSGNYTGNYNVQYFEGTTYKGNINLGGYYNWNEHWKTGLGFTMENNRDTDDFRAQTSDMFRYNLDVEVAYAFSKSFFATLRYSIGLHPNADIYLLNNPSHQVSLGFDYKLPWL